MMKHILLCVSYLTAFCTDCGYAFDSGRELDQSLSQRRTAAEEELMSLTQAKDKASVKDLLYRLDLVNCSNAKLKENDAVTYKTYVYYNIWWIKPTCCFWEIKNQNSMTTENKMVTFEINKYDSRTIQKFHYSCPKNGIIREIMTDLPNKTEIGETDAKVCLDYVDIDFNFNDHECELCGYNSYKALDGGTAPFCADILTGRFKDILVVFRSGNHPSATPNRSFFKITVQCLGDDELISEEQETCLRLNPDFTTSDYFNMINTGQLSGPNANRGNRFSNMGLPFIPINAKQVLQRFYNAEVFNAKANYRSGILKLALLAENSCDKELSILASDVVAILQP